MAQTSLTLSDIRQRVRDRVGEDTTEGVSEIGLPDEVIDRLANDGVKTIATFGWDGALRLLHTNSDISLSSGVGSLPTDYMRLIAVEVDGVAASPYSVENEDAIEGANSVETASSTQPFYRLDASNINVRPTTATTAKMYYIKAPSAMSATDDKPELDEMWDETLINFISSRAWLRDIGATLERVQYSDASFFIYLQQTNLAYGFPKDTNRVMSAIDAIGRMIEKRADNG